SAIGQLLSINGSAFTIIGVTAADFTGTTADLRMPDFWVPASMQAQIAQGRNWLTDPGAHRFQIFARLAPTTPVSTAQAHADLLIRQFGGTFVDPDPTTAVTLQRTTWLPNTDDVRFRGFVAGSMLIVGLVLFVACANVGNMLLARGASRQREIATRLALGAGRARVIRQLLVESVLLAGLGGAAGLAASIGSTRLIGIWLQGSASALGIGPIAPDLAPDRTVFWFAFAISLGAGLLFGLSPALHFTRPDLNIALKVEGPAFGPHASGSRLRNVLVAAQVCVSVLFLSLAGLLSRGLLRSQAADPGFATRDLYLVGASFPEADLSAVTARQLELARRLRSLPQVAGVGRGTAPFAGTWTPPVRIDGRWNRTLAALASGESMATLGIPVIRGSTFPSAAAGKSLAIVSESSARKFWGARDPIGQTITIDLDFQGKLHSYQVAGVARDVRFANLTRVDPSLVYLMADGTEYPPVGRSVQILLRTRGDRGSALRAVEAAVGRYDTRLLPDLALPAIEDTLLRAQRAMSQTLAFAAMLLAGLALMLASTGIYGVVAFLVSQRTREIGVRMALGASPGAVLHGIILSGLRPVGVGAALGMAAAAGLSLVLHQTLVFPGSMDFLYGVPFYDPPTFAGICAFIALVTALASAAPARRAATVDPMVALRYE
ncbi:MAG TPA: FtsX-like permease family protein, partial [Bryobacteraceae bacterium]|nr:FtsX-like permease family protein [Bryobacteraceae bacterium]